MSFPVCVDFLQQFLRIVLGRHRHLLFYLLLCIGTRFDICLLYTSRCVSETDIILAAAAYSMVVCADRYFSLCEDEDKEEEVA